MVRKIYEMDVNDIKEILMDYSTIREQTVNALMGCHDLALSR